jgi:hypothetical protein
VENFREKERALRMDSDTFYWLFSSMAQTYGAIIGIAGLLTVYRLENYRMLRSELRERNIKTMERIFGQKVRSWSPKKMIRHFREPDEAGKARWDNIRNQSTENELIGNFEYDMKTLGGVEDWCDARRRDFVKFLSYHLFLMTASLAAISFVPVKEVFWGTASGNILAIGLMGFVMVCVLGKSWHMTWTFVKSLVKGIEEEE